MKILQVHNRYRQRGGEDTAVEAEAELLRAAGHSLCSYVVSNPESPFRTASVLSLAAWNPIAQRAIRRVAQAEQPDLAHVHNTWFSLSPSIVVELRKMAIPVIMTLHNYRYACLNGMLFRDGGPCELCVGRSPRPGVRFRCYRGSLVASAAAAVSTTLNQTLELWAESVTVFILLTEFARERMVAAGLPAAKMIVKPNFVADPGPRLGAPSDSGTVLFVGRISPEKGLEPLLKAWSSVDLPYELWVLGEGPERERLQSEAIRGVRFLGRVPPSTVTELMLSSRALLFPSRWYEGLPMTILEAFACGLPVMANALGSVGEVLRPTPELLVHSGNHDGWLRRLEMLKDGSLLDSASSRVRRAYEQDYSPARNMELLDDVYQSALG